MNLYVTWVWHPDGTKTWWMWDANRRIKGGTTDTLYDLLHRWRGECGPHSNAVVRFDGGPFTPEEAERLFADSRGLPKITSAFVYP